MRRIAMGLVVALTLLMPTSTLITGTAYAACATGTNTARDQVLNGIDETNNGTCNDSGVNGAISAAVTILSIIVGVVAVIMVILGGFKYITSGGDSGKVASAKSTLVYALIGLAVAALAQLIVHFVLFQSNNAANPPCPSNPAILKSDPACH